MHLVVSHKEIKKIYLTFQYCAVFEQWLLMLCFRETFRKEGIVRGFYAGTVPSLAANVAENSVLFAGYGICQKLVGRTVGISDVDKLSVFHNGMAGFCAAFFSSLVLCPTELIKCRLQVIKQETSPNIFSLYLGNWLLIYANSVAISCEILQIVANFLLSVSIFFL